MRRAAESRNNRPFMRHLTQAALLPILCFVGLSTASAQQIRPALSSPNQVTQKAEHRGQEASRGMTSTDEQLILNAALRNHARSDSRLDCSHLVHVIYGRAGFSYSYAKSSDLYRGAQGFRRVSRPEPGDLIAWPGHVGIVVNPPQHSFFSKLRAGLGIDFYDAPYWKRRGVAHFYRFVKVPPEEIRTATRRSPSPSLQPVKLAASKVPEVDPDSVDTEDNGTTGARYSPDHESRGSEVAPSRGRVIESTKPEAEQVRQSLNETFVASAGFLRNADLFQSSGTFTIVDELTVQKVKLHGNQGWADVQLIESSRIVSGKLDSKKRSEKQRWILNRVDARRWELVPTADGTFISKNAAVPILAHRLAALTEADSDSDGQEEKAEVAALLSALLQTRK